MKRLWILMALFLCSQFCFAAFPLSAPAADSARATVTEPRNDDQMPDISSLTVKEYEHRVGKKLTFREKLSFMLLRNHLKRADGNSKRNAGNAIGGFFLGLLVPGLGLLIAYLLPKNQTLRSWALIGTGVFVLLALFLIALGSAFNWN